MRDRPSRRGGAETKPRLQVEIVDLVDNAVDVIAKRGTLSLDLPVMVKHFLRPVTNPRQRVGPEPKLCQTLNGRHLGFTKSLAEAAPGIGKEM